MDMEMKMDQYLVLLDGTGLEIKTGIGYTGSMEKYLSALQRFNRNHEKNNEKVMGFFNARDYENLMITVHALKSNARMIGALELSAGFEALEKAAREKDSDFLEQMTPVTLRAYDALIKKLDPIAAMDTVRPADEISAQEATETAERLLEALDDFDDGLSKELINKLSGYPFRFSIRDKLKEAEGFIDDFMYDEAADIVKEIYGAIE